ncbi:MAG: aminotransferase class V-fold PLP-dependent enzyme [Acutalibacteraceae bacterium]
MIYFDNAATSAYKPKGVQEALIYDLTHSANSGRSGHKYALDAAVKIEDCRQYLGEALNAPEQEYSVLFTKNCTEALNLGIFGFLREGMRVVTTAFDHNSVLRPLFELERRGKIQLFVVEPTEDGVISPEHLDRALENADFCAVSAVSNVTGAKLNMSELSKSAKKYGVITLIDGAQAVPIVDVNMKKYSFDMLAAPGHKGLHGVQGTGFLVARKDLQLQPLLMGGTGTASNSTFQPTEPPEAYEAGTLFAGGIAALHAGAKWSFQNRERSAFNIARLADELIEYLRVLGAEIYTKDGSMGVVSFNLKNKDSSFVADLLSERDFAVRAGLHCAPLTHRYLKTENRGAVRVSIGVDNTDKEIYQFVATLERINAIKR